MLPLLPTLSIDAPPERNKKHRTRVIKHEKIVEIKKPEIKKTETHVNSTYRDSAYIQGHNLNTGNQYVVTPTVTQTVAQSNSSNFHNCSNLPAVNHVSYGYNHNFGNCGAHQQQILQHCSCMCNSSHQVYLCACRCTCQQQIVQVPQQVYIPQPQPVRQVEQKITKIERPKTPPPKVITPPPRVVTPPPPPRVVTPPPPPRPITPPPKIIEKVEKVETKVVERKPIIHVEHIEDDSVRLALLLMKNNNETDRNRLKDLNIEFSECNNFKIIEKKMNFSKSLILIFLIFFSIL